MENKTTHKQKVELPDLTEWQESFEKMNKAAEKVINSQRKKK